MVSSHLNYEKCDGNNKVYDVFFNDHVYIVIKNWPIDETST
jgi:hypothetical protein